MPAVGNNGFPRCGFTDRLATLPTAPQDRKSLEKVNDARSPKQGGHDCGEGRVDKFTSIPPDPGGRRDDTNGTGLCIYSILKGALG